MVINNLTKKRILVSVVVSSILMFSGCGSNSSSGGGSNTQTASFIDSPVENLDYKIGNQTGVTDNDGYFTYNSSDENITFYVGDLKLGTFELKNIHNGKIFPADLVGVDVNNTTNNNLIKIIRFLQSIDNDDNPNNGIYITDNIKTQINNLLENNSTYKQNFLDNNLSVIKSLVKSLNKKFLLEREARDNYAATLKKLGYTPTKMPFITVWEVNSSDKNITIPINPKYAGEYNYTVDWGDGTVSKDVNSSITHTYSKDGNYTVKISGKFPAIYLNNDGQNRYACYDYVGNADKLIDIKKWGDIKWQSFKSAFAGASKLEVTASDTPNLKNVKDMSGAFAIDTNLSVFNNIDYWNVSNVTDMSDMFDDAMSFNQPLDNWNVSNVTDMSWMFNGARSFNQPLNNWNVSNVTNMSWMFSGATSFDQPLNNWNVSNVTNMASMFSDATSFNQPLNNWNVSNVTDMFWMFGGATSFNQPLNDWNVSNVTDMENMFDGSSSFNQPLNNWNVSNVTNMSDMFYDATSFNQPLDNWNVSNVTVMNEMFSGATSFNQPLNNWNVSNVINMSWMFSGATSFDQNISMWDVSNVKYYDYFAYECLINGTDKMPKFK